MYTVYHYFLILASVKTENIIANFKKSVIIKFSIYKISLNTIK